MYLQKENREPAAAFVNSALWADIKKCLMERRPPGPKTSDMPHEAAAKGYQREAFEKAIEAIQQLPFLDNPADAIDPFNRPAITDTRD